MGNVTEASERLSSVMRGTTPEAERIQLGAIRKMDPLERIRQVPAMSERVRLLTLQGLPERPPNRTQQELMGLIFAER